MDTISRENNTSILPIAGIIAGGLAAVLAIMALVQVNKVKKDLLATDAKATTAEETARDAASRADGAKNVAESVRNSAVTTSALASLASQTQGGFNTVTGELTKLGERVAKLESGRGGAKAAAKDPAAGGAAPAGGGAADGTYVVKSGDGLAKIAKSLGVTLSALQAANPGVDSSKLKIGQKLNVPKR